jgi:hypothetical protein
VLQGELVLDRLQEVRHPPQCQESLHIVSDLIVEEKTIHQDREKGKLPPLKNHPEVLLFQEDLEVEDSLRTEIPLQEGHQPQELLVVETHLHLRKSTVQDFRSG